MSNDAYASRFEYRNSTLSARQRIEAACYVLRNGEAKIWKRGGGWFSSEPRIKAIRSSNRHPNTGFFHSTLDVFVDGVLVVGGSGTSIQPAPLTSEQETVLMGHLLAMFDRDLAEHEKKVVKEARDRADEAARRQKKIDRGLR